ncbi:MAG: GAF domain-containing protein [Desulfobacterales bacterium]|nr:MAG: GAF domain-containing protein [Desulfobacterales bacterium]
MGVEEKIDIDVFKVVFRAIAHSDNLEIMATHLTQLLVGALEIKGCSIFALNPETEELEPLASFGLSISYMNKGPLLSDKSIAETFAGKPTVIRDVSNTDRLQYPEDAKKEGIGAIVSLPINFYDKVIGALRLYHRQIWDISERDIDSLLLLADNVGLAMMYTRVLNALQNIKDTVNDIHTIWLLPR